MAAVGGRSGDISNVNIVANPRINLEPPVLKDFYKLMKPIHGDLWNGFPML